MPYNPYYGYNQSLDNLGQLRNYQQQSQQNGINWVQGEDAAKAYLVAPGCSVLLMDSETQCFYIKSTDVNGMPQPLRIFDYTERSRQVVEKAPHAEQYDTYATHDEIIALEERIKQLENRPRPKMEVVEVNSDAE